MLASYIYYFKLPYSPLINEEGTGAELCPAIRSLLGKRRSVIREVKHHVYVRRQTRICTTWPSFPFTCPLLFIISAHKLVVSRNFLSIRIVLSSFYLLICYFEKFSAWIWRLPFAVYVKLKFSIERSVTSRYHGSKISGSQQQGV